MRGRYCHLVIQIFRKRVFLFQEFQVKRKQTNKHKTNMTYREFLHPQTVFVSLVPSRGFVWPLQNLPSTQPCSSYPCFWGRHPEQERSSQQHSPSTATARGKWTLTPRCRFSTGNVSRGSVQTFFEAILSQCTQQCLLSPSARVRSSWRWMWGCLDTPCASHSR